MKITYTTIILLLIVLAGMGYYYINMPTPVITPKSTLVIAVKDAPKQSPHGTITSLIITFSEVSVHKALTGETINTTTGEINSTESNETEESGWIKVVDQVQTIDLLQFTDVSKILGQKILDSGKYTQIRLKIDSGKVTIDGVTYDVIVPSKVLKLNRGFELIPNVTLKLTLDFKAEKSLVKTGSDKFILKPVIAVISEAGAPTTTPTTTASTVAITTVQPVTTSPQTTIPVEGEGILLMKIKDKTDLTNITAIKITINKVEVHKAGPNDNDTESDETFESNDTSSTGWITVVSGINTYNLLDLVDKPGQVMGQKTLSSGKYTQIRLYVSSAELTLNNKTYSMKVPSSRFYWIHPFNIEAGKTTSLTLDFDASDSITETGKDKYILKPVVKILSEISTPVTTISTTVNTTSTTISTISSTTTIATTTTSTATTTTTIETTTSTTTIATTTTTTTIPESTTTTV
jgi:hypothetical protein